MAVETNVPVVSNPLVALSKRFDSSRKVERRVDTLITKLQQMERLTPFEALNHSVIEEARKLLKGKIKIPKEKHQILKLELLAARLGVRSEQMNDPQFVAFAEKRRLYNYLAAYGHTLSFEQNEIHLGPDGKKKPWSEVSHLASQILPNEGQSFVKPWYYGEQGMMPVKDMFQWKDVRLLKHDDPQKWGGGYAYQLCTTAAEIPRLNNDHTFLRLCTPKGEVYSAGLYRPDKNCIFDSYLLPLRIKRADLMSPDVSDLWGIEIQELPVAVTEERFQNILSDIKADKGTWLRFHPIKDNCTSWAANKTGFHINCRTLAPRALVNYKVVQFCDRHFHKLPQIVQRVATFALVVIFNLISFFGGSFWVDREMAGEEPHLSSLSDIISSEKLLVESPHQLGMVIIPQIKKWREETVAKLREAGASEEEIHAVQWGLPPEDWTCSSGTSSKDFQPK